MIEKYPQADRAKHSEREYYFVNKHYTTQVIQWKVVFHFERQAKNENYAHFNNQQQFRRSD